MKNIGFLFMLLVVSSTVSQNISNKQLKKLYKLNVNTTALDLTNIQINNNLNKLLKHERKRKVNKTIAIVATSFSVSSLLLGTALLTKKDGISEIIGGVSMAGAVIYGGISIPFWLASKKRKKERDKLLKLF